MTDRSEGGGLEMPGEDNVPDLSELGKAWDPDEQKKKIERFEQVGSFIHKIEGGHVILATVIQLLLNGDAMHIEWRSSFDHAKKTGTISLSYHPNDPTTPANPLDPTT